MSKFYNYINESKKFIVTIKDIENVYDKIYINDEIKFHSGFLIDYWYEGHKKDVQYYLTMFSKVGDKIINYIENKCPNKTLPYYDRLTFINNLLQREDLPYKPDDLYPISIYISADQKDKNTIGLIVNKSGKIEEFEGNDEATNNTLDLVDYILGTGKEIVTVYCNQEIELVNKIEKTKVLPKNLYVSPDKKYAEGYWSLEQNRIMFSCQAERINFNRESNVDWRVKNNTKVKNFKYI